MKGNELLRVSMLGNSSVQRHCTEMQLPPSKKRAAAGLTGNRREQDLLKRRAAAAAAAERSNSLNRSLR
jgi:hypothetical protein